MIKLLLFIIFTFFSFQSFAQTDLLIDSLLHKNITVKKQPPKISGDSVIKKNILPKIARTDSSPKKINAPAIAETNTLHFVANDSSLKNNIDSLQSASVDSAKSDSTRKILLTVQPAPVKHLSWIQDTGFSNLFKVNFNKNKKAFYLLEDERHFESNDFIFYALAVIMLFLGFIKIAFPKYFFNIFRLFFRSSFRQKHNREVILQDNLPSLLTNILFFLSGGMFIALIADLHHFVTIPFALFFLYCTTILAVTYVFKFAFIRLSGWLFNATDASENYISVVFLVNKLAGIIILPLSLLIAFSENGYNEIIITIGISIFILLLIYRYIMMLSFLRSRYSINPFHFFIYLCCVEIIPMLVIYKVLFNRITGVL